MKYKKKDKDSKLKQNKIIPKMIENFLGMFVIFIFLKISFEIIIKKANPQR